MSPGTNAKLPLRNKRMKSKEIVFTLVIIDFVKQPLVTPYFT